MVVEKGLLVKSGGIGFSFNDVKVWIWFYVVLRFRKYILNILDLVGVKG